MSYKTRALWIAIVSTLCEFGALFNSSDYMPLRVFVAVNVIGHLYFIILEAHEYLAGLNYEKEDE